MPGAARASRPEARPISGPEIDIENRAIFGTGPDDTASADAGAAPAVETLTKRADFLAANGGARAHLPGFVLLSRKRDAGDGPIRVGFTCSKKVGNAVARNRAKRRLREIARAVLPRSGRPGHDYVLIGRRGATATLPFAQLLDDLRRGLGQVHR